MRLKAGSLTMELKSEYEAPTLERLGSFEVMTQGWHKKHWWKPPQHDCTENPPGLPDFS
jgi:hypothetical protein